MSDYVQRLIGRAHGLAASGLAPAPRLPVAPLVDPFAGAMETAPALAMEPGAGVPAGARDPLQHAAPPSPATDPVDAARPPAPHALEPPPPPPADLPTPKPRAATPDDDARSDEPAERSPPSVQLTAPTLRRGTVRLRGVATTTSERRPAELAKGRSASDSGRPREWPRAAADVLAGPDPAARPRALESARHLASRLQPPPPATGLQGTPAPPRIVIGRITVEVVPPPPRPAAAAPGRPAAARRAAPALPEAIPSNLRFGLGQL